MILLTDILVHNDQQTAHLPLLLHKIFDSDYYKAVLVEYVLALFICKTNHFSWQ